MTAQRCGAAAAFQCEDLAACSIDALGNVTTASLSGGQVLAWNSGLSQWENVSVCGLLSGCSIGDLGNVATTAPATGQVLTWNGTDWAPAAPTGGAAFTCGDLATCSISSLSDVNTAGATTGQVLGWNGTDWAPIARFQCADLNGCSIGDLGNVSGVSPTAGQALVWNGTEWAPATIASGGSFTCASLNTCSIDGLSDVVTTGANAPSAGQVLQWDGSRWAPAAAFACSYLNTCSIDALADVVTTGANAPTTGYSLTWDGTKWAPAPSYATLFTRASVPEIAFTTYAALGVPVGVSTQVGGTATATLTNTTPRPMTVTVMSLGQDAYFGISPSTTGFTGDPGLELERSVNGGPFSAPGSYRGWDVSLHLQIVTGGVKDEANVSGSSFSEQYMLAPGNTLTYAVRRRAILQSTGGGATNASFQIDAAAVDILMFGIS